MSSHILKLPVSHNIVKLVKADININFFSNLNLIFQLFKVLFRRKIIQLSHGYNKKVTLNTKLCINKQRFNLLLFVLSNIEKEERSCWQNYSVRLGT